MPLPLKKEKVLVIESDAIFGKKIVDNLKTQGYNVQLFNDGIEGLKAISDFTPNLVLVNIILPSIDGYAILAKKNADQSLAKIPLFLLSTQGIPIDMAKIPQGSVTEFILDLHADVAEILNKVDKLFGYSAGGQVSDSQVVKKKILWVEDDKLIGTILSKKLIASGFDLIHAKNGEEAMAQLAIVVPDAIVLDLMMPGMSGFDILQKIRADQRLKQISIMVLSNINKQSDIERAKLLGAKKFLVKAAVSLDDIVSEVKKLCE
ncbi:MAG: response regulator [Patescibacteria group bacterium]